MYDRTSTSRFTMESRCAAWMVTAKCHWNFLNGGSSSYCKTGRFAAVTIRRCCHVNSSRRSGISYVFEVATYTIFQNSELFLLSSHCVYFRPYDIQQYLLRVQLDEITRTHDSAMHCLRHNNAFFTCTIKC